MQEPKENAGGVKPPLHMARNRVFRQLLKENADSLPAAGRFLAVARPFAKTLRAGGMTMGRVFSKLLNLPAIIFCFYTVFPMFDSRAPRYNTRRMMTK